MWLVRIFPLSQEWCDDATLRKSAHEGALRNAPQGRAHICVFLVGFFPLPPPVRPSVRFPYTEGGGLVANATTVRAGGSLAMRKSLDLRNVLLAPR
jgi:hypothetical protein